MPTECSRDLFGYEAVEGRQVVAAFDGGQITSDAGALLLGAANRAIGLVGRLAGCFADGRCQELVEHGVETMLMQRICRHRARLRGPGRPRRAAPRSGAGDPGRQAGGAASATVRRSPARARSTGSSMRRPRRSTATTRSATTREAIERLFVDLFLEAHHAAAASRSSSTSTPPTIPCTATRKAASSTATTTATATCRCTSSVAATCSPPSCGAPTSTPRRGRSTRSPGSSARSGRAGRGSEILMRADFGLRPRRSPPMAVVRDGRTAVRGYVFGLARNARLLAEIEPALAEAKAEHAATGEAARRFRDFPYRTLDSWSRERRVVAKAEHLAKGANPRFVVTSLPTSGDRRPSPLRADLLRPRRDGEPDQGAAARPVRRPHLGGHHARQPAAAVVRLVRLRAARGAAPDRPARHPAGQRHLRHDPPEAVEDRRPGPDQRPPDQARHGLGLPLSGRPTSSPTFACAKPPSERPTIPRYAPASGARLRSSATSPSAASTRRSASPATSAPPISLNRPIPLSGLRNPG